MSVNPSQLPYAAHLVATIPCAPAAAGFAEEILLSAGAQALTWLDAGDHPIHEPGPGDTPLWPESLVRALFPGNARREEIVLALVGAGLIKRPAEVVFTELSDRSWERAWMERFEPMRFGARLWICPSHIRPDPDWPVVIRLDPGLAFGSGTHPTTALCLEWLDGAELAGIRVIDYGAGCGVLAIAAALAGASRVIAVDHDPQALASTRDNAARNGVDGKIEIVPPSEVPEIRAEVVIANILAGTLIELSPRLRGLLAPGGRMVLSGLLREQADAVRAAYAGELELVSTRHRMGWTCLVLRDPGGTE